MTAENAAREELSAQKEISNESRKSHKKKKRLRDGAAVAVKKEFDAQLSNVPHGAKDLVKDFTLHDITEALCQNPPDFLDIRDEQLSLALLDGMERCMLDDIMSWFLHREDIHADEKAFRGPPKWCYSEKDTFDCYDYYAATGCPNCGSRYELEHPYAYHLNPPTLVCLQCGHRACQLHLRGESESLVERLEKSLESHTSGTESLEQKIKEPLSVFNSHQCSLKESEGVSSDTADAAVYVRGTREQHDFGQKGKEWWQMRYLPRDVRLNDLTKTITMIAMMSKLKAPTIKELCEVCGHMEAYYTTYQARSADEGVTIMYECTRCHHRKTFNN